jgi:glucosamine--fructose-6-phosphate aminotransferase (isomerizing)
MERRSMGTDHYCQTSCGAEVEVTLPDAKLATPARSQMLEEIFQQPAAIQRTLDEYGDLARLTRRLTSVFAHRERLVIAASGSSRNAALAGEIVIEDLCHLAVDVEYASEYLYRTAHSLLDPALMVISQSGETADTLAVLRQAGKRSLETLAITNVANSSMMNAAGIAVLTHAGEECAIPATKSFTNQLVVLQLFALALANIRGSQADLKKTKQCLARMPEMSEVWLPAWQQAADGVALRFRNASAFMFLGRGIHFAIAREGALKLKETAYRQAEAYPAGEVRHGPQALVSPQMPAVVLATRDDDDADSVLRYRKTLEIIAELRAKGGEVIALSNQGDHKVRSLASSYIEIPSSNEYSLAILGAMPLQLLAYSFAVNSGINPDRPRHLSKAVMKA